MYLSQEHRDWLTLALVPSIGTTGFIRLLARFKTPGEVLQAPRGELAEVAGKQAANHISQYKDVVDIDEQERLMEKHDVRLVTLEDAEYPLRLAEIYNPPLVLFVRGTLPEPDAPGVAVVGTRRATPYGIRMAERFGCELAARGVVVVSGMAAGIDAAAHRGALQAGTPEGRPCTVAVLGCGVDVVYPKQHESLMADIISHGAVVSQFPMGSQPSRQHFPVRNEVISGMSSGTLIVEAPLRSGALITARRAAEQGREVFAVPGQVGSLNSEGPHALIREGARLVERVEDILAELSLAPDSLQEPPRTEQFVGAARKQPPKAPPETVESTPTQTAKLPPKPASAPSPPVQASADERRVLSALSPSGSFVDEIAQRCSLSVSEALSSLTMLELKGLVRQFSGKRFAPR